MDIRYLGAGCVKLSGRQLNVVCDPLSDMKVKADVVTLSTIDDDSGMKLARPEGAMILDGPGEYEVKGVTIVGVPARLHIDESGHRCTVYSILIDGVNVVVTGNIAGKLDDDQIENLSQVDVLVLPIGGRGLTLDAQGAAEVVAQLEPNYVIPVHYDDGITSYPVPQAGLEPFLTEMGATPEPVAKIRITPKEAPDETQVVILERSSS